MGLFGKSKKGCRHYHYVNDNEYNLLLKQLFPNGTLGLSYEDHIKALDEYFYNNPNKYTKILLQGEAAQKAAYTILKQYVTIKDDYVDISVSGNGCEYTKLEAITSFSGDPMYEDEDGEFFISIKITTPGLIFNGPSLQVIFKSSEIKEISGVLPNIKMITSRATITFDSFYTNTITVRFNNQ